MNEHDAEIILSMTRNIKTCPNEKCSACSNSVDVINKQVNDALTRYQKLEEKYNKLKEKERYEQSSI